MADSEERDDDSHGGDSDDEIAELRIQALLSKRVNEAEVSPARDPPQKQRNVNKPFPAGRPRPFRPAQDFERSNHQESNNIAPIPVLGSQNYNRNFNPSYHHMCQDGNFYRNRNFYPHGYGRGRGGRGWGRGRGRGGRGKGGYVDRSSQPTFNKPPAPELVLPQDNYIDKAPPEPIKTKEKMSARWRRIQGSDSESDSEDSESDSSDSSSDSTDSSSGSSSVSSSGSDSESENSSVEKQKATKDIKRDVAPSEKKAGPPLASSTRQRQQSSKGLISKSPPAQVTAPHNPPSPHKALAPVRRGSVSPPSKKYVNTQVSPRQPPRRVSTSPPSNRSWASPSSKVRTPVHHQGSRSPPPRTGLRSPIPQVSSRGLSTRSRSRSPPPRRRSRSPLPWPKSRSPQQTAKSPVPRLRSRSPFPRRSTRSPIPRRGSRSPHPRRSSRSPLTRRSSRSPLPRNSRSPLLRRSSRSPLPRRSSRSPHPRRSSRSPLPRRNSRSSLPRRSSRSPPPRRNSRSPIPRRSSRGSCSRLSVRGSSPHRLSKSPGRGRLTSPLRGRGKSPQQRARSKSPCLRGRSRSPLPQRSPLPRRSSRSPHPYRGSRSPVPRRITRSPLPRRESRSPALLRVTRSPPPRRGSRSPPTRRNSRSPPPRRLSRSPLPRKHSRTPLPRRLSRSPLSHKLSRSPPPRKLSRSPPPRKLSRSPPPRHISKSPLRHRRSRSLTPHRHSHSPPHRRLSRSPPLRQFSRSPQQLRRLSRSPPPRRLSRSPTSRRPPRNSPLRRFSRSPPLHRLSRSPPPRQLSRSPPPRRISRSPPGCITSRSPIPRHHSKSPLPLGRSRNLSPRRVVRSPSPRRTHRNSPSSHRSHSPGHRLQRCSRSPAPERRLTSHTPPFNSSHSPGPRRGPGLSLRSHSPTLGRSPSPAMRRDWEHRGKRSRSPVSFRRSGSPYGRNSRSLSPHSRIATLVSAKIGRSPVDSGSPRSSFHRQGYGRPSDNTIHGDRFSPQGNSGLVAGRPHDFPSDYGHFSMERPPQMPINGHQNHQHFIGFNEPGPGVQGEPAWLHPVRREGRDQFSPQRLLPESSWQGQYQQRDRPGPPVFSHPEHHFPPGREQQYNAPGHSRQGPGMLLSHGRGQGLHGPRHGSPRPHTLRQSSPQTRRGRSPPRHEPPGRFNRDLPPQGLNERRRQLSPNRQLVRTRERSRSNSPFSGRPQTFPQGGRGGPLSPRGRIPTVSQGRRGPRTPPMPPNRKVSPRPGPRDALKSPRGSHTSYQDNKAPLQTRRQSPPHGPAHERPPPRVGSNQPPQRRQVLGNSPPPAGLRTQDIVPHKQRIQLTRNHSPSFQGDRRRDEKQSEDVRDRIRDESSGQAQHDKKDRRLESPRRSENRQKSPFRSRSPGRPHSTRGGSVSSRGRGNRGGRLQSPNRNRRQLGPRSETSSSQQRSRSPGVHEKNVHVANLERRGAKSGSRLEKVDSKSQEHSPERQGRNGSPWLEPVTPEKQGHGACDRSLSPTGSVNETQRKPVKQETKTTEVNANKGKVRVEKKVKEEGLRGEVTQPSVKVENKLAQEQDKLEARRRKFGSSNTLSSQEPHKIVLKGAVPSKEVQEEKKKNEKLKEELDDKKKKKKKKRSRDEEEDDDASEKSKSSKKKKKKKKKESKKKKKKHKKEESDSEEEEEEKTHGAKNTKDGKKESIDSSDLRHMLKRKVDPPGVGRSESKMNIPVDEREKRRRKDKEDSSKTIVGGKSRQTESRRKKQHDGKPLLVTVGSGEDRQVTSGNASENRGDEGKASQRLSVHLRLGPAKTSWDDNKSGNTHGSGGGSRQKRRDKSKGRHGGGTSNRVKLRR